MHYLPKTFQGLRWKLTLSYTLVTIAAFVAVLIIAAAGVWFVITNSNLLTIAMISIAKSFITPSIVPYLDDPQPDLQGLTRWLQTVDTSDGLTFQSPVYSNIRVTIGDSNQNTILLVLDGNLETLAGLPEPGEKPLNMLLDESKGVLAAALAGEQKPERISYIGLDQSLTLAVPVISPKGAPLGVVVLRVPNLLKGFLLQILSFFGRIILVFTFAIGILGAIFGFFTARGMMTRLQNITQTASSWSQGDFSTFIRDRSGDELGQMTRQLNRMAEQLQNLLQTRQELAALEERNRLARDLHDSVKQQIFATIMQVGAAQAMLNEDSSTTREHLNEAEQLARQAQRELDTLIRELRPATLQETGLPQALKEYATGWSRQNLIPVEFQGPAECILPQEVKQALFRVTQEALSNIARHSEATHVEIRMEYQNNELSLTISDNGTGFDINAVERNAVGLRSMRERMEGMGGELSLESAPGQGTCLTANCRISSGGHV